MCTKHLDDGPLVCQEEEADEDDGHAHHYASSTGSWLGTDKDHG